MASLIEDPQGRSPYWICVCSVSDDRKIRRIWRTTKVRINPLEGDTNPNGTKVTKRDLNQPLPDPTGKLSQIYPNPMSLMVPGGVRENSNFLRPGKPFRIPDRSNVFSGFEFIASPPAGTAMVVAILSDRPVQKVDLPDVPVSLLGSASAVDYLTKVANELRIPDAGGTGRFEEAHWSFDAKFYAIR